MKKSALSIDQKTCVRIFQGLEIHIFTGSKYPDLMEEIGRIREREFRAQGGGTGKEVDIDAFDTGAHPYQQMIAWDPENLEIVSMYRFRLGNLAKSSSLDTLATHKLFSYSEKFLNDYLPKSIELGRSVVNRQAKRAIGGLFAIWSGLGALISEYRDFSYFFGKVTTYRSMDENARNLLFTYLSKYHGKEGDLLKPREGLAFVHQSSDLCPEVNATGQTQALTFVQDFFSKSGQTFPPLVNSYISLTPDLAAFGTVVNPAFGSVLETGIMVPFDKINPKRRKQFITNYQSINQDAFTQVFQEEN